MGKVWRIGILSAVLAGVPLWAQDDGGGFLERQIENRLSGENIQVRVRGFQGALSSQASVASIVISDSEGVWLTVNDALLDWNRTALLRGRLQVRELSAQEVIVERRPVPGNAPADVPSPEAQPFSLPDLPVSVNVDEFAVERLALGETIIGQAVEATISGSANLAGGEGAVDISAERTDGERGRFEIAGSFDNDSRELALNVQAEEGPDGIIVSLADIPGQPSLDASITGEGPLSDFTAEIDLATDGEPRLDGTVTLMEEEGANRFTADVSGDVTALFSPQYRPFFGPNVDLQAAGARFPDGRLELSALDLTAQSLDLTGQVAIGADGVPTLIDVEGRIAADDGSPVRLPFGEQIEVDRVDLNVSFDASQGETWTADIVVDQFDQPGSEISRIALNGQGVIDGGGEDLTVTAGIDLVAEGVSLDSGALDDGLGDRITGRIDLNYETGQAIRVTTLDIEGAGFTLDGQAALDPAGANTPVALVATLEAADLSLFQALADRPLSGSANLDLDLNATLQDQGFDVSVSGVTQDLVLGIDPLDPLLGGRTDLALDAARDGQGTRLRRLSLDNEAVDLTAEANITSRGGNVQAVLAVLDLSRVDPGMTGPGTVGLDAESDTGEAWQTTLRVDASGAEIDADVTVSGLGQEDVSPRAQGSLTAVIADLSDFAGLAGRPLDGRVDLAVQGASRFDLTEIDADVAGTLNDVAVGIEEVDALLAGTTIIDIEGARSGDRITLDSFRISNPQITATANADVAPGDSTVTADIVLAELAAIAADLSGSARLSLDATESGEAWDVALTGDGAGAEIDADVTLTDIRTPDEGAAAGTVALSATGLDRFSALAGRPLGGSVDLTAEGRARFDLMQVDATLNGTSQDLAIGQEILDRLLAGRTVIALDGMRDGGRVTLDTFEVRNPQIVATANGRLQDGNSDVTANVRLDDLSRVVDAMSGPATLALQATEEGSEWDVTLDATGARADVEADLTLTNLRDPVGVRTVAGNAAVSAEALSVFSQIAGRDLGGALDLRANGSAQLDLERFDVTIDGIAQDIAIGQAELDRLLQGRTTLEGSGTRTQDALVLDGVRIENPQITATAQANVAPGDTTGQANVRLADLQRIVPAMSGAAVLSLDVEEVEEDLRVLLDGTGAGAEVDADVTLSNLREAGPPVADGMATISVSDLSVFSDLANRPLGGSVNLDATGRAAFDLSEATLDLDGQARSVRIGIDVVDRLLAGVTDIVADVSQADRAIVLDTLRIANPQITVSGEGRYGDGDTALDATVSLPQLSLVVPQLSGPADLRLFAEEVGRLYNVRLNGSAASATLTAEAEVANVGTDRTPVVSGDANVSVGDLSRFSAISGQALRGSLAADVSGRAAVDGSQFDGTVTAEGRNLATGIAQADQILGATTTLRAEASRTGADAPIRVSQFSLDAAQLAASASGTLLGGRSNLDLNARLANLGIFVPGFDGAVVVDGTVGQAGQAYALDLDIAAPQGAQASVSGQIAQSFNRANLSATGSVPLILANPFIEPRSLSGDANFDLSLNGPLALGSLGGTVTLANGQFVEPTLPFVLNDIGGTARFSNSQVVLDLTAQKPEGGSLAVTGPIGLTGAFAADLAIALNGLVIEDPRLYRTSAGGTVTIVGPLTGGATIGGTIVLGETEVRIPSTGLGATGPIPDGLVHINETLAQMQTRQRAGLIEEDTGSGGGGGGGVAFPLDLTIVAQNQIFIRGRGLDAELGGSLTLQGTTANVIPAGQFELIRGRIDILGQRILLTEGFVNLAGDFTPRIRLVAETDTGDVTVFIIVEGQALEPDITFSSSPDLPQDEVLARLIFGRSIQEISPLQAAQLANAVATLSGRGGIGIVSNLREATGFDDLDVTTDADGNVGVRAGRYLSENVYTDVTVNASGEAEINLNLDVSDSVTVRGSTSSAGAGSVGVFFERDY